MLAALVIGVSPRLAHAHLVSTGFGSFYDGLAHLVVTPEDLLPVLALSLWAGLRGPAFGRVLLLALPVAWLAGTAAGHASPWLFPGAAATAATTVVLGILAAADGPLGRGWVPLLAALLGLLHGGLNGVVLARASLGLPGSVGVACAVFVVVSLGTGLVASLRTPWTRVATRVAGSWIAATGLLMLGWAMRG